MEAPRPGRCEGMKSLVFITGLFIAAAAARADFTDGLLAAYFFDGNAEDASGRGNDAQLIGATFTEDRFGRSNGALLMDGQGGYASTPVSGKRFPIAFSFWLRLDARRLDRAFSVVDSGIGDAFGHSFVIGNNVMVSNANMAVGGRFRRGEWAHVVVSYGPRLQVFINGELAGEREYAETDDYAAGNFQIGRHFGSEDARYFHGAVDDLLIFARPVSGEEARALFERGAEISQQVRVGGDALARLRIAAANGRGSEFSDADSAASPRPILAISGPASEPHTNAWHIVDGDVSTLWAGASGEPGWWWAAEFYPMLTLGSLEIDFAEDSPTNFMVFVSETADEWIPFRSSDEAANARFLLLTFPRDDSGTIPVVRELRWNTD